MSSHNIDKAILLARTILCPCHRELSYDSYAMIIEKYLTCNTATDCVPLYSSVGVDIEKYLVCGPPSRTVFGNPLNLILVPNGQNELLVFVIKKAVPLSVIVGCGGGRHSEPSLPARRQDCAPTGKIFPMSLSRRTIL